MLGNDNSIKTNCSNAELQKILSGSGNYPSPSLDLPSCDGKGDGFGLVGYPLASVYAPMQSFDNLYELDNGFYAGTIFKELDLPFSGRSLKYKGNTGGCYDK